MELVLQIRMNEALYLRNPEASELGKRILKEAIILINEMGFESFTFKKLANEIGTTEASIYRYFENKHRLLVYLVAWYWSWLEYQIVFQTNNITDPVVKLKKVIDLLTQKIVDDVSTNHINEEILQQIVIYEGAKSFLTKHVSEDNQFHLFKPYKDLSASIALIIQAINPKYPFPKSLASSMVEISHFQHFFMNHLPSLTDFKNNKHEDQIVSFLNHLVFSSIAPSK